MMDYFEIIKSAIGALVGGAAVYAGIKAELSEHKARIIHLERSSDQAHTRIDSILSKGN